MACKQMSTEIIFTSNCIIATLDNTINFEILMRHSDMAAHVAGREKGFSAKTAAMVSLASMDFL